MNARVDRSEPEMVTLEVDGVELQAPKGSMLIQATDPAGIDIPRFCYHRKLSIAANCRMCLVEVERAPKPLPACATPVAEGMKVWTRSKGAVAAQRGVMEFLLINHPLDCPICDQGGECELQDLSMGFGRSLSRFSERKRVVKDEDLGPLVATEMTRCIHCTRCVRFLDEIAGQYELGGMYRGEHMEISTFSGRGVRSELSGNIIDLCPVGALTSKPFRFRARAWEMLSHPGIAPHDAIGSNLYIHQVQGTVKRVVPRDNEKINESWIADRDRFSYEGVYSPDRLQRPLLRRGDTWEEVKWQDALQATVMGLQRTVGEYGTEQLGAWVSPSATLEEMYLLGRLLRGLGCHNIDHRLRQADFRDDTVAPAFPYLGLPLVDVERLDAALVIGSYTRWDLPLFNHRLRKAALAGGKVMFLNPRAFDWNFPLADEYVVSVRDFAVELALIVAALAEYKAVARPERLDTWLARRAPTAVHRRIAERLAQGERSGVFVGALVEAHPAGAELRALAALLAELSGSGYGVLSQGANSAGAWQVGAIPQRQPGHAGKSGLNLRQMIEEPRRGLILFNVEPEFDCWDSAAAQQAVAAAEFVLVFSPYVTEAMRAYADVILPMATFTETAGTFVNAEGLWQSFSGLTKPPGEARPAWRILRVLGNQLGLEGFEYNAPNEIYSEIRELIDHGTPPALPKWQPAGLEPVKLDGLLRVGTTGIYALDPLVRRAAALQRTVQADDALAYLAPQTAARLGIEGGAQVRVCQRSQAVQLRAHLDPDLPADTVWISAGLSATAALGPMIGQLTVECL
ncbi:NADH-quinone oxidoreductase subunit NuoG [Nitrococcus mobilis]|uniref:NADH-quinone oxidoreductase n=1 Tax=Nitrococcus mobilis Nb-231 TaxID=314278 RepID=A4BTQ8_9GAMM|nr:NADH-quinone oxidoreductase subunit NuoG [Nitrococcus mobilis]EAR20872.1 NADH dehydrogenase gamma subunit [Nitrococcus mobilis Nb-231]